MAKHQVREGTSEVISQRRGATRRLGAGCGVRGAKRGVQGVGRRAQGAGRRARGAGRGARGAGRRLQVAGSGSKYAAIYQVPVPVLAKHQSFKVMLPHCNRMGQCVTPHPSPHINPY